MVNREKNKPWETKNGKPNKKRLTFGKFFKKGLNPISGNGPLPKIPLNGFTN